MPRYPGFVGQTYTGRSITAAGDRCINLYPESTSGAGAPESAYVLLSTPGMSLFASLPTSPLQAVYTEPSTARVFAVAGKVLYEVTSTGAYTARGTLDGGFYSFASNGSQVMIACASTGTGYIFALASNSMVQITASGFMGAAQCTELDGYFIARVPNSRKFQISALLDGTQWDGLDFALSEGGADNLLGMVRDHEIIWLMGSRRAQVYSDTGAANFPIEPAQSLFMEHGLAASQTLVELDNTIFWLGQNKDGQCRVFRANGFQPLGISNRSVEWFLNQYAKRGGVSDAVAYGYQNESGHTFYVLSFPSATSEGSPEGGTVANVVNGATWVYDVAENLWHERASLTKGVFGAHAARYHTFAFGNHLVGGGDGTGNLYVLSEDVYQDNGKPTKRIRRAPHLLDELKIIKYKKLRLNMNVGVGPTGDPNNAITLRISNDGGATWGNEYTKPLGDAGNYQQILEWRALGRAMRRNYEASTTINAPVCIVDAYLELEEGTR